MSDNLFNADNHVLQSHYSFPERAEVLVRDLVALEEGKKRVQRIKERALAHWKNKIVPSPVDVDVKIKETKLYA